ncbi:hypothetical protein EJ04DRAFT_517194 [Polyplosphaeria fusca]|uniref:Uncharacterized protein n=1 Tax=Polyplosphaeria fusca TaxID=682080 RepID=A0A9P4QHS5_9PLEO|nr:hypothetical protein EJ04DRAFT_517194 [Polyplosphaeria fusca]
MSETASEARSKASSSSASSASSASSSYKDFGTPPPYPFESGYVPLNYDIYTAYFYRTELRKRNISLPGITKKADLIEKFKEVEKVETERRHRTWAEKWKQGMKKERHEAKVLQLLELLAEAKERRLERKVLERKQEITQSEGDKGGEGETTQNGNGASES